MPMPKADIIKGLSMSYGIEKAEVMLDEILRTISLTKKDSYTKDEVIGICNKMEENENNLVKAMSKILKTKAMLMSD